jgi:hypothetical protein
MPRTNTRFGRRHIAFLIVSALLAVTSLLPQAARAATPTPSPTSASSGASTAKTAKPPTVTFGIGPSDGKKLDGRPYFSYAASPGSVINDHFELVNVSNQTLNLLVYGASALTNASGGLGYQPDGAKRTDAGAWLRTPLFNGQPLFRIRQRSTVILPFQLEIPANAQPGDHTAGIAVGLVASIVGKNTKNFNLEQRVVAKVYVRVSGTPVAKLEVSNVHASYTGTLNPLGKGDAKVTYTVRNTGNVDLAADQKVSISGLFGGTGSATPVRRLSDLIPGSTTNVTVHFHGVLPEVFLTASVRLQPQALPGSVDGKLRDATGSTQFWAIPWAFVVLVIVLGLLTYFGRRYLKRRAASRPAARHNRSGSRRGIAAQPIPESEIVDV